MEREITMDSRGDLNKEMNGWDKLSDEAYYKVNNSDERERLARIIHGVIYKTTPINEEDWFLLENEMGIPRKIAAFIIKDRQRICEPLVKSIPKMEKVPYVGSNLLLLRERLQILVKAIDQVFTLAGLDAGEREK